MRTTPFLYVRGAALTGDQFSLLSTSPFPQAASAAIASAFLGFSVSPSSCGSERSGLFPPVCLVFSSLSWRPIPTRPHGYVSPQAGRPAYLFLFHHIFPFSENYFLRSRRRRLFMRHRRRAMSGSTSLPPPHWGLWLDCFRVLF